MIFARALLLSHLWYSAAMQQLRDSMLLVNHGDVRLLAVLVLGTSLKTSPSNLYRSEANACLRAEH